MAMWKRGIRTAVTVVLLGAMLSAVWGAQPFAATPESPSALEQLNEQKEMILEIAGVLPGEAWVEYGREIFFTPRGPNGKDMAACEWGGDGEHGLKGAYARMPRYFPDTGRVEDLDNRIVSCMTDVQGFKWEEIQRSDVVSIAAFIASESNGAAVDVSLEHPDMRAFYEVGEELWNMRVGTRDFSCAVCHDLNGDKRLRQLPAPKIVQGAASPSHWPAYRYRISEFWTLEDRVQGCYLQMLVPEPEQYSDAIIALVTYMKHHANGTPVDTPGFIW